MEKGLSRWKKIKISLFFSGRELTPLRSPASIQPSPMHRKSSQLSISTPLALQSIQSDGKDGFADDIEAFVQFFEPFPYRLDFPHEIVHSCRDRAKTTERVIQENNSVWGALLSMQKNLPWPCVCWWESCKEPLKDVSKATMTLGWWELIWDVPIWTQEAISFRTSTSDMLFPSPPKHSWLGIEWQLVYELPEALHSTPALRGRDENHPAWLKPAGVEKKRAAMCGIAYEDFPMKGRLLRAMVQLWLQSSLVAPGCVSAWAEGGGDPGWTSGFGKVRVARMHQCAWE